MIDNANKLLVLSATVNFFIVCPVLVKTLILVEIIHPEIIELHKIMDIFPGIIKD